MANRDGILHRLFAELIGPAETCVPWASLDLSHYSPAALAEARATWAARAQSELDSMRVVAQMSSRSLDAGLPLEAVAGLSRIVRDELRHAALTARLAEALGASRVLDTARARAPSFEDGLPPKLSVARWTASLLCVGETASLTMLSTLRVDTTDPCARAVVTTLLRDEVAHARIGWSLLSGMLRAMSEAERRWLEAAIVEAFEHYDRVNAGALGYGAQWRAAAPSVAPNLGVLSPARAAWAYYTAVERRIVPGFEALGFDAQRLWAIAQRASP